MFLRRLQKQRLKYANTLSLRDSIRNEVAKQRERENEMKEQLEQQKMDINNYNTIINMCEMESVGLRQRYDESVKERNDVGMHLMNRGEEVAVICERSNLQDSIAKNGNIELQAIEEEIRFLKITLEEEKRKHDLFSKAVPNEESMKEELESLRNQVSLNLKFRLLMS